MYRNTEALKTKLWK